MSSHVAARYRHDYILMCYSIYIIIKQVIRFFSDLVCVVSRLIDRLHEAYVIREMVTQWKKLFPFTLSVFVSFIHFVLRSIIHHAVVALVKPWQSLFFSLCFVSVSQGNICTDDRLKASAEKFGYFFFFFFFFLYFRFMFMCLISILMDLFFHRLCIMYVCLITRLKS